MSSSGTFRTGPDHWMYFERRDLCPATFIGVDDLPGCSGEIPVRRLRAAPDPLTVRVGRLLITLLLISRNIIPSPLPYLSARS